MKIRSFYDKLRDRSIGPYLARTTDYYERTKIQLNFNFSLFVFATIIPSGISFLYNGLTVTAIPVLVSALFTLFQFLVLIRWQNVRLASIILSYSVLGTYFYGLFFIEDQLYFGAPMWITIQLILLVFNLGFRYGMITALVSAALLVVYFQTKFLTDLAFVVAKGSEAVTPLYPEFFIGFSMMIYLLHTFFKATRNAEQNLKKTNQELESQNGLILRQRDEKTILLQEVHHRVKNNLQVVRSLIRLREDEVSDETSKAIFFDTQQRISAMALIHERMYKVPDLAHISMKNYLTDFLYELIRQYSHHQVVQLNAEIDLDEIDANNIVPFGLILNELVSNSLEHGIQEAGLIHLSVARGDGSVVVVYRDSGIGFQPGYQEGFGSELIRILTDQLNGTLHIDHAISPGVYFQFEFPSLG